MTKETERIRSGLSNEQKTNLTNRLFFAGFDVDKNGFICSACSGDRPRSRGHDVPAGYIGNTSNGYYTDLIHLNLKALRDDHTILRRIYNLV